MSSVYDPLALAAPFILEGRVIIQKLCKENSVWDKPIPRRSKDEWKIWKDKLRNLEKNKVTQCFKPRGFSKTKDTSVHLSSDASETGYGQAGYLQLVNQNNQIHCILLIEKSKVILAKYVIIPKLELIEATLSIKMSQLINGELELNDVTSIRTDSQVVLGYINNESKRFKVFVANRVEVIHDNSNTNQWHYIDTKSNPADDALRGLDVTNTKKVHRWYNGPGFLWQPEESWSLEKDSYSNLDESDPEIKHEVKVNVTRTCSNSVSAWLEERISDLDKNEKDVWDCSEICTHTEAKAVTTIRCISSYTQWCGRQRIVGKGKLQNHQDAPTKRIYGRTKDYKEGTQAKSQ